MINATHCPLTGYQLDEPIKIQMETDSFDYQNELVGRAIINVYAARIAHLHKKRSLILAGICRNIFENGQEPFVITQEHYEENFQLYYPKSYFEKKKHLLKYIFKKSGIEHEKFNSHSAIDFTIAYCQEYKGYSELIHDLEHNGLINIDSEREFARGTFMFQGISITEKGESYINESLPWYNLPLNSGDEIIDKLYNHAGKLFYTDQASFEDKRSACQELANIMEFIRSDFQKYFSNSDESFLYGILNNYSIRHNKTRTMQIKHTEQLEWIYYSLKITIITYFKMKKVSQ